MEGKYEKREEHITMNEGLHGKMMGTFGKAWGIPLEMDIYKGKSLKYVLWIFSKLVKIGQLGLSRSDVTNRPDPLILLPPRNHGLVGDFRRIETI